MGQGCWHPEYSTSFRVQDSSDADRLGAAGDGHLKIRPFGGFAVLWPPDPPSKEPNYLPREIDISRLTFYSDRNLNSRRERRREPTKHWVATSEKDQRA